MLRSEPWSGDWWARYSHTPTGPDSHNQPGILCRGFLARLDMHNLDFSLPAHTVSRYPPVLPPCSQFDIVRLVRPDICTKMYKTDYILGRFTSWRPCLEYIYKIIQIILQNSRPACQHLLSGSIISIRAGPDIQSPNIKTLASQQRDEAISAVLNPQHKVEEKQVVGNGDWTKPNII